MWDGDVGWCCCFVGQYVLHVAGPGACLSAGSGDSIVSGTLLVFGLSVAAGLLEIT